VRSASHQECAIVQALQLLRRWGVGLCRDDDGLTAGERLDSAQQVGIDTKKMQDGHHDDHSDCRINWLA
jgi:hypothetical protein